MRKVCALILLLFLAACGESATPTPTLAPTPTPDPATMLRQAGETMVALDSVHFLISRTGGPAYFDEANTLNISSAAGDYAAPASVDATVKVLGPGLALEVETVAIGEEQWITNPLTRQWEKLPPGWGFNPALIFDADTGWERLFSEDVDNVTLAGIENINDQRHYHLQATVSGERVATVTAGIATSEDPVTLDVWVNTDTFTVTRLAFATPSTGDEPSHWELIFSQFDAGVSIEPPL